MDKFIPAEWESSDDDADETDIETMSWGDHYSDYLTCGAQLLRHRMDRDSELIERLTAAAARGPGEPFGPLSEDEAELVVLLACNGPWHRRTSSEVVNGKRFRSPRPAVQVFDPRYRDWRLASSVFPHATWGMPLHQGNDTIDEQSPVAWELPEDGLMEPTERFLLEERGELAGWESGHMPLQSFTLAELEWLRHTGLLDAKSWVYFVEDDETDWGTAMNDGPPSEGWMLIDDAIAEHRARRTVSTGSQQPRSGGVPAMSHLGQATNTPPVALDFTDLNFQSQVMQSDVPVLVDFWVEWCDSCRRLGPTIDELANEFAGLAKVGKVNVDNARQVAMQFGIQSIPTLVIIKGGQVQRKWVGIQPKSTLAGAINAALIDDAIDEHPTRRAATFPAVSVPHASAPHAAPTVASHVHPPAAPVPIVQQAPSTGQQIMTTAAGVAVAAAGIRAAGAIGDRVSQWAQANNAPEVMGSFDATGDGAADFAVLDTNMNGIADGADTVVFGDAAQGAVEASNSVIDTIAEWFS